MEEVVSLLPFFILSIVPSFNLMKAEQKSTVQYVLLTSNACRGCMPVGAEMNT